MTRFRNVFSATFCLAVALLQVVPAAAAEKRKVLRSLKPYGLPSVVVEPARRVRIVGAVQTFDLYVPGRPVPLNAESLSNLGASLPTPPVCKDSHRADAFTQGMSEAGSLKATLFPILPVKPDAEAGAGADTPIACDSLIHAAAGDRSDLPISKTPSVLGCCRLGFIAWQNILRKQVIYRNDPAMPMNMRLPADSPATLARRCQQEYKRGASLACFAGKGHVPGHDNPLPGCFQMGFEDFTPASNAATNELRSGLFADYDESVYEIMGDPRCAREEFTPPFWEDATKPGKAPALATDPAASPRFPAQTARAASAS